MGNLTDVFRPNENFLALFTLFDLFVKDSLTFQEQPYCFPKLIRDKLALYLLELVFAILEIVSE